MPPSKAAPTGKAPKWKRRLRNLAALHANRQSEPDDYVTAHMQACDMAAQWPTCAVGEVFGLTSRNFLVDKTLFAMGLDFQNAISVNDFQGALDVIDAIEREAAAIPAVAKDAAS